MIVHMLLMYSIKLEDLSHVDKVGKHEFVAANNAAGCV
jgi:hypothetical protein